MGIIVFVSVASFKIDVGAKLFWFFSPFVLSYPRRIFVYMITTVSFYILPYPVGSFISRLIADALLISTLFLGVACRVSHKLRFAISLHLTLKF